MGDDVLNLLRITLSAHRDKNAFVECAQLPESGRIVVAQPDEFANVTLAEIGHRRAQQRSR